MNPVERVVLYPATSTDDATYHRANIGTGGWDLRGPDRLTRGGVTAHRALTVCR